MVRKVSEKTKREVYDRDRGRCVLCGKSYPLERTPHHAWFGAEANYKDNRNDVNQLVTICIGEHFEIHHKGDKKKREQCKQYLVNYYS